MKKLLVVLGLVLSLSACSNLDIEIRNPEEGGLSTEENSVSTGDTSLSTDDEDSSSESEVEPGFSVAEEPAAESFDRILVYQDDNNSEYAKLSDEQLGEWLSIIKPEEWKEDTAEKEGGHLSDGCIVLGGTNAAMYIGIDYTGDEVAIIKWGGIYSKSYVMQKGTFEEAKSFEERIKKEQATVFNYPECNYDMSVGAFVDRENDEYILWYGRLLDCLSWPVATGLDSFADYKGYSSTAELNAKQLFNCFMFIFDENRGADYSGRTEKQWYNNADGNFYIPFDDIHSVLGKYFSGCYFDYSDIDVNCEFNEEINGIVTKGGYGIGNQWRGRTEVVSVEDNGDGTVTAVIEVYPYVAGENDGMHISEKPLIKNILVLRPYENGCFCESYKIEKID